MITVKRLYDAGAGGIVDYLVDSVADGPDPEAAHAQFDGTAYYTQAGTPPGRWMGAGLAGLDDGAGLEAGSAVSAEQLRALIEAGQDPVSGQALGRAFPARISPAERVRALVSALPEDMSADERAARTAQIEREVARASRSRAVHGFDFTFAPPKSASVLWALGDAGVREQVEAAHHEAIAHVVGLMEASSIRTRTGSGGVVQAETRGVVAAAFDHWDSRAGDPHLHTHLVVANRVQGPDGAWRTLDSHGALLPAQVALSEAYDNHLMDALSSRLGVEWSVRSISRTGREHWEIDGVDDRLLAEFSTRHADIDAARDQADGPGHWRADERAWSATRAPKRHRSLAELSADWRERAARATGAGAPLRGVLGRPTPAPGTLAGAPGTRSHPVRADDLGTDDLDALARRVVADLAASRPSWTMWNARAEAARACRRLRFSSPEERDRVTEAVATAALGMSVRVDHARRAHAPDRYRRPDGSSRFIPEADQIFTTQELLDAEDALLVAAEARTAARLDASRIPRASAGGPPLGEDQARAIEAVATSGRQLDLMVGPAGTGKTTALRALADAWQAESGSVIALAPSQAAAQVLSESLGVGADNTAMWLTKRRADAERAQALRDLRGIDARLAAGGSTRQARAALKETDPTALESLGPLARRAAVREALARRISALASRPAAAPLGAGDLVIIDEASMAATLPLRDIVSQAGSAGAKVLCVGDPDQLAAVEAGGAFGMLVARRPDAPALRAVRRFDDDWQGEASLALRAGDARAIGLYERAGAIRSGERDEVLDQVRAAWADARARGRTALMIAPDNATAAELSRRARADLLASGDVRGREAALADSNRASAGDLVVTRRNARHLRAGRHWAHNGATWRVQAVSRDGALLVTPADDATAGAIHLPAAYVARDVELAYATTIHRAQGRTVDEAHVVVDPSTGIGRQGLYVGMTRGRGANIAHVVTDGPAGEADDTGAQRPQGAVELLGEVIGRDSAPLTARRAAAAHADKAESIAQLANEYTTIAAGQAAWGWEGALPGLIGREQARRVLDDPHADALMAELDRASRAGADMAALLPAITGQRPLDPDRPAADLAGRARAERLRAQDRPRRLIAGLIPAAPPAADPDTARALSERERMITERANRVLHTALSAGEPWCAALGPVPADPTARSAWLQAARTVAAYRDRWRVATPAPAPGASYDLGAEDPLGVSTASTNRVQAEDRRRARHALQRAQEISATSAQEGDAPRRAPQVGARRQGPATGPSMGPSL